MTGRNPRPRKSSTSPCEVSGKSRFATKAKAIKAKDKVNGQKCARWGEAPITNIYKCDLCGGWHFTSLKAGESGKARAIFRRLMEQA